MQGTHGPRGRGSGVWEQGKDLLEQAGQHIQEHSSSSPKVQPGVPGSEREQTVTQESNIGGTQGTRKKAGKCKLLPEPGEGWLKTPCVSSLPGSWHPL